MELQISYSICPKIQEKNIFWRIPCRNKLDTEKFVRVEECKNSRGRGMYRPCAYVVGNTTQNERVGIYGVFER